MSRRTIWASRRRGVASLLMVFFLGAGALRAAVNVGYYDMSMGSGDPNQVPPITAAGQTPVQLMDLQAADLAGVKVLVVQNPSNGAYGAEYLSRLAVIQTAVANGLILVIHDEYVSNEDGTGGAKTILPGGSGFVIRRDFTDPNNIDVRDNSTPVTDGTGAGGTITSTSLDNGGFSDHGYADASTLPAGTKLILSRTDPSQIVTFLYPFGNGAVLYSTIPLDHFLMGAGPNPPQAAFAGTYAVNVVDYAARLAQGVPDLGVTLTDGVATAVPGTSVTYTLVVKNFGIGSASGSVVMDDFPPELTGVTWTCTATAGASCTAGGSGDLTDVVNVPVGGVLTYTATGVISPSATGTLENVARVMPAHGTDPIPSNDSATDDDTLTPVADLTLAKAGPASAGSGPVTYTLTVKNAGPSDAYGVSLADPTPPGLTFSSASALCAGGFPCSLGTIAAGGQATVTVTFSLPSPYLGPDPIVNLAAATTTSRDPVPANNSARSTTPVGTPSADLAAAVSGPPSAALSSTVTFTVTVTNNGPHDAQAVSLAHTPPAGLLFTGATAPCAGGFPCSLGTLNAGAAVTVKVTFGIPGGYSGANPIVYSATATSSTADPTPGNNSASASVPLGADTADLTVTKTGPTSAALGANVTYTLVVTNRGPAAATGIQLRDPTPAGLTFVAADPPCAAGFPCALGTLAAGQSITVKATFQIPAGYSGANPLANVATVVSDTPEGSPGDNTATALTGIGADAADLTLTKMGPGQVAAGSRLSYVLLVTNKGPATAHAVSLAESAPASLVFRGATAPCASGFPCNLGNLPAGTTLAIGVNYDVHSNHVAPNPLVNTASVSSADADPNPGDNSAMASTTVVYRADLAVTKTDGVAQTSPGLPLTYTIVVTNNGPSDVAGATVTDNVPAALTGVTWTCAAGSGASCTASGSGSINDTVNLAAGASLTYTLTATVGAGASGSLSNTATAAVPGGVQDPVAGNNSATDTDAVVQPADLTVTKTGPASVAAGTNLAYTVTVKNQGTGAATHVVLTDPTPPGLTFVSASGPCSAFPCTLADLPAGQSSPSVTVTYAVPAGYTTPNPIQNTASVTTDSPETSTANNSATASTPVVFIANLAITKTDGKNTVVPGDPVTYTIVVTNAGPSNAVNASVTDNPPALLQNVQWTCAAAGGASCGVASGTVAINTTPSIPVGGSVTYTLTATVDPAAQTAVVNTASVSPPAGETDPVPGNNNASDSDGVTPKADLAITKTDGLSAAVPGRPVTYAIVVSNLGPSNVTGATVQDAFPAALQSPAWTCAATGGAACGSPSGSGSTLTDLINLPSGGTVTYTVTATVSPSATGTLTNTATVTAPPTIFDPALGNNTATDSEPLTRVADLTLTKLGPGRVERGAPLTFTFMVANAGPSDAAVTLTDPTPAGLTFATADAPCAGGFPCNLGTIAAGATLTFTATWTVPAAYAGPDPIVNVASVQSDASDPHPADDTARSATAVARAPQADLAISKTAPAVASVGSTVTYRLTVTNNGPDDAQGVVLSESIPAGLSFVSATAPCQTGFDCALGTLNAGASRSVDVTLSIPAGYSGPSLIVNTASVTATTADPTPGNNAANAITSLVASAIDLDVVKLAPVMVDRGQDLVYTLKVTNHGPATATNVFLADPTPSGLTFASATAPCAGGFPCFLNTLAAGQTVTVLATYHVPAGYAGPDPIVNTASATANEPDGVSGNDSATTTTGVGHPSADLEVVKTAPAQAAAGSLLTATIVVRNLGPGTALATVLSDPTPTGTTFVSASAPCAGGFPCNLGDLAAGSAVTVTATFKPASSLAAGTVVTNTASVASNSVDPQTGNNSSQASTTIFLQADLAITKTDGKTTAVPGSSVTYTITVTNNGPSDAPGARVTDTFPAILTGVSWTCSASAGSSCAGGAAGAGNIDRTVNVLAGGTVTYTATATISPAATGTLANTAAVQAPAAVPDPVAGNNSATDTDTLTPQADLAITKTDGKTTAVPGGSVTYTITVTNNGPSNASGVTVADSFPGILSGVTWTCTASAGSHCSASGVGQILDVIDLASGGTAVYTATATISAAATGTLANTATVTAPAGVTELNPANNSATDTDTLTPQADLAVTKDDGVTTATPGGQVTYVITVTNNGPSDVAGATVTDSPPAVVTAVSWTCTPSAGAHCTASGNGGIADSVDLPAGKSVTYTLTATINPAATGTLTNQATVAVPAGVTDPTPGNNTATDSDTLSRRADLAVTLTDGRTTISPGDTVTYTLVVTNNGPSNVTGASVTDLRPSTLTGVSWTCTPSPGSVCQASGTGDVLDTVSLPVGGTLTYQVTATVVQGTTGAVVVTATVGVPAGTTDPVGTNNQATDSDSIAPVADLGVTLTADQTLAQPSTNLVYTLKVTNAGPANVTGARVTDTFPAAFTSPVWTCAATPGSTCPAGTGGGNLNALVNVAVGGTVTFTITGQVSATPPPSLTDSASVAPPAGTTDPNNANDTVSLTLPVGNQIFKDGFESGDLTAWSGHTP
ncbi:MAG TPA: hypothetical protein VF173_18365 [Thermoanaerobaculia bacterium]|nr:hypothetical protein [Thermoanaerobaculia bacterium]